MLILFFTLSPLKIKEITPNKETNNETAKWNNFAEVVGNKVKVMQLHWILIILLVLYYLDKS